MRKVALLIGISDYGADLNPLPASVKDMQAIAKVLQHPEMGDFAQTDVQKLENPDPQKMQEAIEMLFSDRRKDDLVVFYFSGHGIKDESGKLHLATRLTRKNPQGRLIKSTTVPASFVHNIMSDSHCKRQVIILDCCFSGAFAEGWSAKDDGSLDIRAELGGEGRVVLTSSTATEYSFQQQEANLSIYTRYLIEGIETGAADLDSDGAVSVDELHEYAKRKVQKAAPAMQPEIYAVKEGFKILLSKAPIGDPKLKYRKEVEIYASRGEISIIGRRILDALRQNLGLLPEETAAIEAEVLKPYQDYKENLQKYQKAFIEATKGKLAVSDNTHANLKRLQQALGLRDGDIAVIESLCISSTSAEVYNHQNILISTILLATEGLLKAKYIIAFAYGGAFIGSLAGNTSLSVFGALIGAAYALNYQKNNLSSIYVSAFTSYDPRKDNNIWKQGNSMIALALGGTFLGGLIAQIPGSIIGAICGLFLSSIITKI